MRWLWDTDREVEAEEVEIGAGVRVPTYRTGADSHGWWAMVILLIVIGMMFIMTVFAYLYLYGVHPTFWTPPPPMSSLVPLLAGYGGGAGLALFARRMLARPATHLWTPGVLVVCAAALLLCTFALDLRIWAEAGLVPSASGQGAVISAFLAQQGALIAVCVLMAAYLSARNARGLLVRPRCNTMDLVVLFLAYSSAQGGIAALLTRLFPAV